MTAEAISSTEISVQWNGLSTCRLVNGLILSYRIRFITHGRVDTIDKELGDGEDWRSEGEILLTGLTPFTNYSIAVAAVNKDGDVGLYSNPVTILIDSGAQQCFRDCMQTHSNISSQEDTTGMKIISWSENFHYFVHIDPLYISSSTGITVGVVTSLVGIAVGISGLIGGAVIAKRCVHR